MNAHEEAVRIGTLRVKLAKLTAWLGNRTSYTKDDLALAMIDDVTNEERADIELFDWHMDKPRKYFAYYGLCAARGEPITNWTGRTLGYVIRAGLVWRSNRGDKRRAFTMQGTNGVLYHGVAYLDAGTYVRLKAAKVQA